MKRFLSVGLVTGLGLLGVFGSCSSEPVARPISTDAPAPAPSLVGASGDAHVELPPDASRPFRLTDSRSKASIAVRLRGAEQGVVVHEAGEVRYKNALAGGDVVHRAIQGGTEDWVMLPANHGLDALRYDVDLADGIAGLRLVERVVEFLDAGGAPRLRMSPPWARTKDGERMDLPVEVEGCEVDRDPRVPFDRPVVPPGSTSCVVRIALPSQEAIEVDPAWVTGNMMISNRKDHAAVRMQSGRVLLVGGYASNGPSALDTAEVFDPTSNTFAATSAGSFYRGSPSLLEYSPDAMLAIGGFNGAISQWNSEVYHPSTGLWDTMMPLLRPRYGHSTVRLNDGRVLIAGGVERTAEGSSPLNSAELYDGTGWTVAASMSAVRPYGAAVLLPDGRVLITGGSVPGRDTTEIYDPAANSWSSGPTMLGPRTRHQAVLLPDGRVLIVGGAPLFAEVMDVAAGTSVPTGPLTSADRSELGLVLLASGVPFMVGGQWGTNGLLDHAATFNAADLSWVDWPSSGEKFAQHTTTLLADGRVLIAGGATGFSMASRGSLLAYPDPVANGVTCVGAQGCLSGICVDGVCCEAECDGRCESCNKIYTGAASGTCAPITAGIDPDDECEAKGAGLCSAPGVCDGARQCATKLGDVCIPTSCVSSSVQLNASICSTSGECLGQGTSPCHPYRCDEAGCLTACASNADCIDPARCVEERCVTSSQLPLGQACGGAGDCASGYCVDGVCCESSCTGDCQSCASAHTGQPSGRCHDALAGTDPRNRCFADPPQTCKSDGFCDGAGACRQVTPEGTRCGPPSCLGSYVAEPYCDAEAICTPITQRSCGAYACAPELADCRTSCTLGEHCASGFVCNAASGECVTPAVRCVDAATSEDASGARYDCAPFACAAGVGCLKTCANSIDCASGNACVDGRCEPATASPEPAVDGGCAVAAGPAGAPSRFARALGFLGLALGLRRRAGARSAGARVS